MHLVDRVASLEVRSLATDNLAQRVELLEQWPPGPVVAAVRFGQWFEGFARVLWSGEPSGPLFEAVAGAGPLILYEPPPGPAIIQAAVLARPDVTREMIHGVASVLVGGGLLVAILGRSDDVPAIVEAMQASGLEALRLTWVGGAGSGGGTLVVAARRGGL